MMVTSLFLEKTKVSVDITNIHITDDDQHLAFDYEVKDNKKYNQEDVEQELSKVLLDILKKAAKEL